MKTWFITGASRGFGTLFVKEALERGDNVVATARNARAVIDKFGDHPRLLAANLDVNDEAQARGACDQHLVDRRLSQRGGLRRLCLDQVRRRRHQRGARR